MDYLRQTVEELEEKAKTISDALLFKDAYLHALSGLSSAYRIDYNIGAEDNKKYTNADFICEAAFDIAQETVNLFKQYKDKQ